MEKIFNSIPEVGSTFPDGYEEDISARNYQEDVVSELHKLKNELITVDIVSKTSYDAGYKCALEDVLNHLYDEILVLSDDKAEDLQVLIIKYLEDKINE